MNHNIITHCSNEGCGSYYISGCDDFKTIFNKDLKPRGWIEAMEDGKYMEFCCKYCKDQYHNHSKFLSSVLEDDKLKEECKCDRCNGLGYIKQEYLNKKGKANDHGVF